MPRSGDQMPRLLARHQRRLPPHNLPAHRDPQHPHPHLQIIIIPVPSPPHMILLHRDAISILIPILSHYILVIPLMIWLHIEDLLLNFTL